MAGNGWTLLDKVWNGMALLQLRISGVWDMKIGGLGISNWVHHSQVSWSSFCMFFLPLWAPGLIMAAPARLSWTITSSRVKIMCLLKLPLKYMLFYHPRWDRCFAFKWVSGPLLSTLIFSTKLNFWLQENSYITRDKVLINGDQPESIIQSNVRHTDQAPVQNLWPTLGQLLYSLRGLLCVYI